MYAVAFQNCYTDFGEFNATSTNLFNTTNVIWKFILHGQYQIVYFMVIYLYNYKSYNYLRNTCSFSLFLHLPFSFLSIHLPSYSVFFVSLFLQLPFLFVFIPLHILFYSFYSVWHITHVPCMLLHSKIAILTSGNSMQLQQIYVILQMLSENLYYMVNIKLFISW